MITTLILTPITIYLVFVFVITLAHKQQIKRHYRRELQRELDSLKLDNHFFPAGLITIVKIHSLETQLRDY